LNFARWQRPRLRTSHEPTLLHPGLSPSTCGAAHGRGGRASIEVEIRLTRANDEDRRHDAASNMIGGGFQREDCDLVFLVAILLQIRRQKAEVLPLPPELCALPHLLTERTHFCLLLPSALFKVCFVSFVGEPLFAVMARFMASMSIVASAESSYRRELDGQIGCPVTWSFHGVAADSFRPAAEALDVDLLAAQSFGFDASELRARFAIRGGIEDVLPTEAAL